MAEFREVMIQRKRMCSSHMHCQECPLDSDSDCTDFLIEHPEKAEKIIMDWAKEHPPMTNADKFKEVFGFEPNTEMDCNIIKCTDTTFNIDYCYQKCQYNDFWNKEYRENNDD